MAKQQLTEERRKRILMSAQIIGLALEVIGVEMQMDLVDVRFNNPQINNQFRMMKQSMGNMHSYLNKMVYAKDKDELQYEFAVEMHRLFTHFSTYPLDGLTEFNDGIEKQFGKTDAQDIVLEENGKD